MSVRLVRPYPSARLLWTRRAGSVSNVRLDRGCPGPKPGQAPGKFFQKLSGRASRARRPRARADPATPVPPGFYGRVRIYIRRSAVSIPGSRRAFRYPLRVRIRAAQRRCRCSALQRRCLARCSSCVLVRDIERCHIRVATQRAASDGRTSMGVDASWSHGGTAGHGRTAGRSDGSDGHARVCSSPCEGLFTRSCINSPLTSTFASLRRCHSDLA